MTDHQTPLTWAFRVALMGFLGASTLLAIRNQSPGSVDSCGNLALARNLSQGRGYLTNSVGQFWVRQSIPTEDTVKPPALPFLLATIFRVAGVSLAVPVLVNGLAVALNALILRAAIRRISRGNGDWLPARNERCLSPFSGIRRSIGNHSRGSRGAPGPVVV